jgi:hypothetical protein
MLNQETMNGSARVHDVTAASAVSGSVASAVHDVLELAELQARLFVANLRAVGRKAWLPLMALIGGLCLVLGITPVLLFAVAEAIQAHTEVTAVPAYLLTGVAAAVLAIGLVIAGLLRLRSSLAELQQSAQELSANLACIRQSLKTSPPNCQRDSL